MWVRIRKSASKLRLSLVETRRVGGKVRHEHVASLGSILQAMTVVDRREFWRRLEPRLAALGNRIDLESARALIAATVPPPTKAEINILDLEEYAAAWRQMAKFFGPHEFKQTPFEAAMGEMSDAVKAKEYSNAMARVAKAEERIERVRKGEDAGLKAPFDPNSPAYRAAVRNMGRVVRSLCLIDDDRLREIVNFEGAAAELKADEELKARLAAEQEKRSQAARKGWRRYEQFFAEQRRWREEQRGRS
jgi:hypothetical protein